MTGGRIRAMIVDDALVASGIDRVVGVDEGWREVKFRTVDPSIR
jgi:hypothetical protein